MNGKWNWEDVYGDVPDSFAARMEETLASLEDRGKVRRFRFRPSALIAAVLAVVLLAGTALATDLWGLKSLIVTDPYSEVAATAAPEVRRDLIALQGMNTSPEFMANAEWMDYLASGARALPETGVMLSPLSDRFSLYSVSTEEQAAALDDIVARYGLRLHSSLTDFDSEQQLCSILGCPSFLSGCVAISGYVYEDGSFQGDGTSAAGRCYEYQFGRYVKGSFSEVTLNVGNVDEYEEWIYTTACGVDVQLSLGPSRCVMMADLPQSFVAVNLLGGANGDPIFMPDPVTRSDLEAFADMFDFSVLG